MTQHPDCGQTGFQGRAAPYQVLGSECTRPGGSAEEQSCWLGLLVGHHRHELRLPRPSAGPCKPLPLLHHSQNPRGWAPKSPLQSQRCEIRGGAPTKCCTMLGRLVATMGSLFWLEEVVPLAGVGGGGVSPSSRLLLLLPHCYLSRSCGTKGASSSPPLLDFSHVFLSTSYLFS